MSDRGGMNVDTGPRGKPPGKDQPAVRTGLFAHWKGERYNLRGLLYFVLLISAFRFAASQFETVAPPICFVVALAGLACSTRAD